LNVKWQEKKGQVQDNGARSAFLECQVTRKERSGSRQWSTGGYFTFLPSYGNSVSNKKPPSSEYGRRRSHVWLAPQPI
jgi:hypothetical protein